MENEVRLMHRQRVKLLTKNMVLKGQQAQITKKIKLLLAKSEVNSKFHISQYKDIPTEKYG